MHDADAQKLFDGLRASKIPVGYVQLDPWAWDGYVSSAKVGPVWVGAGDMNVWKADGKYFQDGGLSKFRTDVARAPLLLYTLFWGEQAEAAYPNVTFGRSYPQLNYHDPLKKRYLKQPLPEDSFLLHDTIFSEQSQAIGAFEVDFLDWTIFRWPAHVETVDGTRQWADGMNKAALKHGISIQYAARRASNPCRISAALHVVVARCRRRYCMDLPAWAMASLDFAAVTNARGSDDNFPEFEDGPDAGPGQPTTRWKLAYSSLFYQALGLAPFFDTVWTTAEQPGNKYAQKVRSNIELQALAAALTSRAIGFGDGPGLTNATLVMRFCMSNGTLLSPTALAQPIDRTFSKKAAPRPTGSEMWVAASTAGSAYSAWQTLAVDVEGFTLQRTDLWPRAAAGATLVAYELDDGACARDGAQAADCLATLDSGMPIVPKRPGRGASRKHKDHAFVSHVIVDVCASGSALLGETAKFVAVADRRFSLLQCTSDGLTVQVHGAAGETVGATLAVGWGGPSQSAVLRRVAVTFDVDGVKTIRCAGSRCSAAAAAALVE